jgi:signal transduction histidine kinase
LNDSRDRVTIEAEDGPGSDEILAGGTHELSERARTLLARLETGVTLELSDLAAIDGHDDSSELFGWSMHSYVVVPMFALDQMIGFVMLGWESAGKRPGNDVSVAQEIAAHLAVAYHHVRAAAQEKSRAEMLEATVIERTKELEERNQDLETFAYSVSHDLRAPLRAMRGFGEAILEDYGEGMDSIANDFMTRIVNAAAQMDDLIQDLLHYSRVARQQIVLQPVSVREVIDDALTLMSADVASAGAIVKVPRTRARVTAHRPTLVLAVSNLVGNALKFRREGVPVQVEFRTEHLGSAIRISVQDNGIGIKPVHQERIFRIFERLHSGDVPGTGLGLAIVKKGVERMGGSLGVESVLGEGSTFWIELPAAEAR